MWCNLLTDLRSLCFCVAEKRLQGGFWKRIHWKISVLWYASTHTLRPLLRWLRLWRPPVSVRRRSLSIRSVEWVPLYYISGSHLPCQLFIAVLEADMMIPLVRVVDFQWKTTSPPLINLFSRQDTCLTRMIEPNYWSASITWLLCIQIWFVVSWFFSCCLVIYHINFCLVFSSDQDPSPCSS
jgi:hypothetical protein